jgi:hypothetical protein
MMTETRSVGSEGRAPWASDTHPADVPKRHVEEITESEHSYVVTQAGTMDGENCRTPHGSWNPMRQTWESNRAVRLENAGDTDVINPWLSNGRNAFRSIGEIVETTVSPDMSDREKAIALYYREVGQRFHAHSPDGETSDVVKVFNIYGYTTCGHDSMCMAALWRCAGLQVRPSRQVGHCITQVWYGDAWHLLDADMQCIYLQRDSHTIAGMQDIAHDHDLVKRTHTGGFLLPDDRALDEWEASLFVYEGDAGGARDAAADHTMDMTLRPGEAITWRWGQLSPVKYHGADDIAALFGREHADTICNGLWEYRPDFSRDLWRDGADTVENVEATPEGLAAAPGKGGTIVWTMRSPYVFVGGRLEVEGSGATFSLSWDGETWEEVGDDLDAQFPRQGPARYRYFLRCELSGAARLARLGVVNDLQMAPLALPAMKVGENRFLYTDESPGARRVRITHQWVERSASIPPGAPPAAVYPPKGGEADGTGITFAWEPPAGAIADYHFELSEYPDMRWPLSPNFRKLISNTADRGQAQYTLPYVGLLAPDRPYYWRVRAQNEDGVWGPWSATWDFTPRAPAPPVEVRLDFDEASGTGTLRWQPNRAGRAPVKYRVYGSDEKGFTVSDEPYLVMGRYAGDWRKAACRDQRPANFIAEVAATELVVVGRKLTLPNANKAFYRVVAVDARGHRSWSSEYVAAPRPLLYTTPVEAARVGEEYRCQCGTIRSLGDAGLRHITKEQVPDFWPPEEREAILQGPPWQREVVSFWDVQQPRFALLEGPAWLTIDEATGLLAGTPDAPGKARVIVAVTLHREVEELDLERLAWGHRVVTGITTEAVGPATQEFVIEVRP